MKRRPPVLGVPLVEILAAVSLLALAGAAWIAVKTEGRPWHFLSAGMTELVGARAAQEPIPAFRPLPDEPLGIRGADEVAADETVEADDEAWPAIDDRHGPALARMPDGACHDTVPPAVAGIRSSVDS